MIKTSITPHIISAALRDCWGNLYTLPPPNRHQDIVDSLAHTADADSDDNPLDRGFLLDDGRFVGRVLGFKIARRAKQLLNDRIVGHLLTTEDLW